MRVERFDQVSISANTSGFLLVEGLEVRRHQHHWQMVETNIGLYGLTDLVARPAGHHDVEQDHVRVDIAYTSQGEIAIADRHDLNASHLQHLLDGLAGRDAVVG
jgi:hypothetical protein